MISYNDISVFTIEMLVIHCVASGLPLPVITWTKDTENLVSDEDHVLITFNGSTMSRLVISDLTFLDNGIYACVGTSDSGNITHRFPISIGNGITLSGAMQILLSLLSYKSLRIGAMGHGVEGIQLATIHPQEYNSPPFKSL